MKITNLLLTMTLLLAAAAPAIAADEEFSTELLSETSVPLTRAEAPACFAGLRSGDKILILPAAAVIMVGAKAWNVIMNGRPSADLATAYTSAIPGFSFNWDELQDWRKVTKRYRYAVDTKLQGRAVDIVYEISFFYGTIPVPGPALRKGHYITNFTVKPEAIDLKWGWKVSLETAMSDPMNVGTGTEPVAWLKADLKWLYTKPLQNKPHLGLDSLTVNGLGELAEVNTGGLSVGPIPLEETVETQPTVNWD